MHKHGSQGARDAGLVPRHTQGAVCTAGRDFDEPRPTLESLDYRIRQEESLIGPE